MINKALTGASLSRDGNLLGDVEVSVVSSFEDPLLRGVECWAALAPDALPGVFATREWQEAWWRCFGRGRLLMVIATRSGVPVALAPFYTDSGMVYFIGSGGSDYLDFIGDVTCPSVLDAILLAAQNAVTDFIGFVFYHVPEQSMTGSLLNEAARRLGWSFFDEGKQPAPYLDLVRDPASGPEAAGKKSLVRHEKHFQREGDLEVLHLRDGEAILPHLPEFFAQHVGRWAQTRYPSLFEDPVQRRFYERLTQAASGTGWLRFTRINWMGRPIAFHFGFCHRGRYLWYKPSFAIDLARRSPGEVLLRQLIIAAVAEGAELFDFGLGDEGFKARFATGTTGVNSWSLYPPESLRRRQQSEDGRQ